MKKITAIMCAIAMIIALVACANNTSDNQTTQTAADVTESTIVEESAQSQQDDISETGFPSKDVTIICPYGAGGGTDLAMRLLAQAGEKQFGQTFAVVNKTGGSGTVGLSECLAADHDGYTLVTASVDLITLPLLGLAPADVTREAFTPICTINGEPAAIIVAADSPYMTIEDFLDAAKAAPGSIKVANSGMGNIWHLAGIGLELAGDVSFNWIPYDSGAADALIGVLNGDVDAIACSAAEAASNIDAGTMRILAVANTERLEAYPDVPTFTEKGIDLVVVALRALGVPSDVDPDIIETLQAGFAEAIMTPECETAVKEAGLTYMPLDAQGTDDILDSMTGNFESIISKYLSSTN